MSNKENWLTAADAAKVLKCSARQVHRYAEAGQLVTRRAGRRVLFSSESVAKLADELAVDYRPAPAPGRDLAPMIDAIEQMQRRDQTIDERLGRIEKRVEQPVTFNIPRWLALAGAAVLLLLAVSVIIGVLILMRLPQ
jgi:hypothetical protein